MSKYYCGDELFARHYNFNMVCGSRLGGKSTWIQKHVIKRAIKCKVVDGIAQEQFALLVRYDKDLSGPAALPNTYFDNTMMMFYPDFEVKYEAGKFYLCIRGNSKVKPILIGYAFAIANATKMKSSSYPLINTLIMEEFMNMEGKYIKSQTAPDLEVEMVISLFSTIARGNGHQFRDNVRLIMISNNFYLDNPYFHYFDFISKIVNNPTRRFYYSKKDPKCLVEMVRNDIDLGVGRGDTYKGSKFIDMQNEIRYTKADVINKVLCQISLDNREFLNFARYNDSYAVTTNGNKIRPDCPVWSCCKIKRQGISDAKELKKMPFWKIMVQEYNDNLLYFDKLESYILFKNILEAT